MVEADRPAPEDEGGGAGGREMMLASGVRPPRRPAGRGAPLEAPPRARGRRDAISRGGGAGAGSRASPRFRVQPAAAAVELPGTPTYFPPPRAELHLCLFGVRE